MKKVLIWAVVIAVVGGAIAVRIASRGQQEPVRGVEEIQAEQGVPVDAVTVSRSDLTVSRGMSGEVFGWRQTNLTSDFNRKVARVYVRAGERVTRGERLLRFDTQTAADQTTRLAQLEEGYANAERMVRRLEPLFEKGAISENELDDARTQLKVAEANLQDARLSIELVSPIDGVVTFLKAEPGDAVEAGQTLAQIAILDSVRVQAGVSAATSRLVRPGARAWVDVVRATGTGLREERVAGRVRRVALGADPENRLYEVEAVLDNADWLLRPGEYATLHVVTGEVEDALTVPRAALLGEEDVIPGVDESVYRVREGLAELRRIRVGAVTEESVQALEGLDPGDRVVVFGANRLRDGVRARFHRLDGERMDVTEAATAPPPAADEGAAPDGETDR